MATFTDNYNLIKPGNEDFYDIADFNDNMDTIDSALGEVADVNEKIGTPTVAGTTVFSLLENSGGGGSTSGLTSIKSIQRVTHTIPLNKESSTCPLKRAVVAANCIVLFERLADSSNEISAVSYTLTNSNISLTHDDYSNTDVVRKFGFWVIEFC